jgi:hypothetical protein
LGFNYVTTVLRVRTVEDIPADGSITKHLTMLGYHIQLVQPAPPPQPIHQPPAPARTEKFMRPKLKVNNGFVSEEDWEYFNNSWKEYKTLANLGRHAREILGACC